MVRSATHDKCNGDVMPTYVGAGRNDGVYALGDGNHIRPHGPDATLSSMIRRVVFFCAVLMATTSAQHLPQADQPASLIRNQYLHAYNLHNSDAVLALYADDAVLLSEAGVFRGKSEIRKWLQVAFDQGSVLEAITATREKSSTTIAYGTGQTKRLVGQEVHLGRYLIVLEKRKRKWIIIEHASFNAH
jgi:ketosteroid isomerase-like protein